MKRFLLIFCLIFGSYLEAEVTPREELEKIFDLMMPAQEKSPEAFAWFSGLPHPIFNAVMHLETKDDLSQKVDELIAKAPADSPLSFWISNQEALQKTLVEKGFQLAVICPVMSRKVEAMFQPRHIVKPADTAAYDHIITTTFELSDEIQKAWHAFLENTTSENYVVYLDERPVGTGKIVINGKVGGIFNVAVLPEYQKQGCGRSIMEFLINRAHELNLESLVLMSSPEAEKLYTDLQFEKSQDMEIYIR